MRPVLQWSSLAFAALVVVASVLWIRVSGGAVLQPWPAGAVTAVLFTTRHDEEGHPRLPFLLASLCKHMNVTGVIHELIVVTPDNEVRHMVSALRVPDGALWNRGQCLPPWPVRVVPDSEAIAQCAPVTPSNSLLVVSYRIEINTGMFSSFDWTQDDQTWRRRESSCGCV